MNSKLKRGELVKVRVPGVSGTDWINGKVIRQSPRTGDVSVEITEAIAPYDKGDRVLVHRYEVQRP